MPTQFSFDGQIKKIPGSYSTIKSGMKNPPVALPYGNVLIIDTGSGAGWGCGAGVDGEFDNGKSSIYHYDNIFDYREAQKGGLLWLLGQPLFRPAGKGVNGVSRVSVIKAATTVGATIEYDFNDTQQSTSGGSGTNITIKLTDEGVIGNGVLLNGNLTKGFGAKLSAGKIDSTKFILTFYRGTYKGLDQNNLPYDGITEANSVAIVVATSPECTNFQELVDWMGYSADFNKYFRFVSSSENLLYAPSEADYDYYADYNLASGGTESYAASALLTDVLTAIEDLDVNFILSDQYGANAMSSKNDEILNHINEASKYKPELYVAAGNDVNDFVSLSIASTAHFDDDTVSVVHGAIYKQSQQGLRTYNSLYHAAAMMAREAGLAPQVPITFKNLDFDGMVHQLNDKEVIKALDAGLLVTRMEAGTFDIVKGINTLQANIFLLNDDGTTHSKQIKRIERTLNNEIRIQSRADLLKAPQGVNRNTLSPQDLEAWLIKYLKSKLAKPDADNLILNFQDITIERQADGYFASYKFTPNTEISFLFNTGLMIGI